MEATKKTIELYCQTKNSHDRISTKTGEIVHAMLDPAYQVAKVLEFLGSVGGPLSPCATAGSALAVSYIVIRPTTTNSDVCISRHW